MTRKERIKRLLIQAQATAKVYRSLAEKLELCAVSLEDPRNTEWAALPTMGIEDLTIAVKAGIVLDLMLREVRK